MKPHKHAEFIHGWLDGREVDLVFGNFRVRVGRLSDFDNATGEVRFARTEVPQWRNEMAKAIEDGKVVEARLGQGSGLSRIFQLENS